MSLLQPARGALPGRAAAVASIRRYAQERPYIVASAAFGCGWAILCLPWLSGAVSIPYDARAHFQAQIQFLANALASGQSPFWNPFAFAGQPHVADPQSMIFSPAFLIAWFNPAPSFRIVDAYVFALLAMGGLAVVQLFREMKWAAAGAVVAAFAFAFGASAALRVQHVGQVQSLAFLMLAQWLLVRTLRAPCRRNGLALGVACALMIVEPDQVALLGAYMLVVFALWHLAHADSVKVELRRLAPAFASAGAICAPLVCVPLLLTWLFVEDTTRTHIFFATAAAAGLHPANLLSAFVPDLFGTIDPRIEYWGPFSEAWGLIRSRLTQNMMHVYIGALPVLAIVSAGVFAGRLRDRDIRPYALIAGLMLLFAMGGNTLLFRWAFEYAPAISGFRRPADATFLVGAYGAIVAGYLVNGALTWPRQLADIAPLHKFGAPAFFIAIFIFSALLALSVGKFSLAWPKILAAAAWTALAAAIFAIVHARALATSASGVGLLALLMVADFGVNHRPNESTGLPPANFDVLRPNTPNDTIELVKELLAARAGADRRARVEINGVGFYWANAGLVHGIENVTGYNPLHLDIYSRATGVPDQVAGWDQRKFSKLYPSYRCLLADMLGVRLIVAGEPMEIIDRTLRPGDLRLLAHTKDAWIYENPRALPRVMFVADWKIADFDSIVESGKWPHFDPRKTVLLEDEPQTTAPADSVAQSGPGAARIVSYRNARVVVEVDAAQPGFLLLNDIWHPWWRARVDGEDAEILRANVLFRAVQVARGRHRIEFEFAPVSGALAQLKERLFDSDE